MSELILKGIMMARHLKDDLEDIAMYHSVYDCRLMDDEDGMCSGSLPILVKRVASITKEEKKWHDAWYDQKEATGRACWNQYYSGVKAARRGHVYEPISTAHKQLANTTDIHAEQIMSMIEGYKRAIVEAKQAGDPSETYAKNIYILAGLEQALKAFV